VFRERSALLDEQTKEALNFQITVLAATVVAWVLTMVTLGLGGLLFVLVRLANIAFCILAALASSRAERYRHPVAWRPVS